jgi:hypothetical protein
LGPPLALYAAHVSLLVDLLQAPVEINLLHRRIYILVGEWGGQTAWGLEAMAVLASRCDISHTPMYSRGGRYVSEVKTGLNVAVFLGVNL